MTVKIRAHFDGKVIVPDEDVELPRDTPLTVHVETQAADAPLAADRQRTAYDAFLARARAHPVPHLPDHALRRESIYED
jgi:hypothetical protein